MSQAGSPFFAAAARVAETVSLADVSERWSRRLRRSRARSFVDANRSSGSFARQRSTIQRTGAGTRGFAWPTGTGSSRMIAVSVSAPVFRWNARCPVASS